MTDTFTLPPRMVWFGEALAPMLTRFEAAPRQTVITPGVDSIDGLMAHLHRYAAFIDRLAGEVAILSASVFENENADIPAVHRATGRLEAVLDEWGRLYAEAGGTWQSDYVVSPRELLRGALRHTHAEIRRWLSDLAELLSDPETAVRKRGLQTSGPIELTLSLTLTPPPQIAQLGQLCQEITHNLACVAAPAGRAHGKGPGFWGHAGAAVLGFAIGGALIGCDDD